MKKIYNIILVFTALFVLLPGANAQTLKIVRTDVDSSRTDFVTAKYLFGVDVIAEDVYRCSAVSFALKWTQNTYVKFSEAQVGYIGDSSTAFVYAHNDEFTDEGTLSVGVTASEPEVSQGYDNPIVIHLEFAVSQAATNGTDVVFSFVSARANVNNDTGRVDITLNTEPVYYTIHSYMDVWPGDADNNGIVNEHDVLPIDMYFDYGSLVKSMRTFKRVNPSTLWVAQRVLAWDDMNAAHADCDGNGVVNETDVLVIYSNVNKVHSSIDKNGDNPQSEMPDYKSCATNTSVSFPITIDASLPIIAAAGKVLIDGLPDGAEILGVDKGEAFAGGSIFSKIDYDNNTISMAAGDFKKNNSFSGEGVLAYLVIEPNGASLASFKPLISGMNGITESSYMFPVQGVTGVEEYAGNNDVKCLYTKGALRLFTDSKVGYRGNISIYNHMGMELYSGSINSYNYCDIYLGDLPSGVYFAVIENAITRKACQFRVVN